MISETAANVQEIISCMSHSMCLTEEILEMLFRRESILLMMNSKEVLCGMSKWEIWNMEWFHEKSVSNTIKISHKELIWLYVTMYMYSFN